MKITETDNQGLNLHRGYDNRRFQSHTHFYLYSFLLIYPKSYGLDMNKLLQKLHFDNREYIEEN